MISAVARGRMRRIVPATALVVALTIGTAVGALTSRPQARRNDSWESPADAISP